MKDVNVLVNNGVDVNKSMELFGDMELYDATLEDFLAAIDEKLFKLKLYKETSDMNNYAIQAHSLKSDARYLGFTRLAELAYNHELKGKERNINYIYENYDMLVSETNRIINVARQYMGKVPLSALNNESDGIVKLEAILVIDDSSLINNFVAKVFNDKYEVLMANDGAQAFKIIEESNKNIVAVLLDLNMPNVDGFQVLDYFKSHNLFVKMPVSIITGNDFQEMVTRAFTYPIVDILSKPFNERDVKRILDKTINFNK